MNRNTHEVLCVLIFQVRGLHPVELMGVSYIPEYVATLKNICCRYLGYQKQMILAIENRMV